MLVSCDLHLHPLIVPRFHMVHHICLQYLPRVLEHLLWFTLKTNYNIPSRIKQCCLKQIWIILQVEAVPVCIAMHFHCESILNEGRGRGLHSNCCHWKGERSRKFLKNALVFQILLAGIVQDFRQTSQPKDSYQLELNSRNFWVFLLQVNSL